MNPPLEDVTALLSRSEQAELVVAPDLTIVGCTEAYARLQGMESATLVGRGLHEAFRGSVGLGPLADSLQEAVASRRPSRLWGHLPVAPGAPQQALRGAMFNLPVLGADGAIRWILHRFEPTPVAAARDPAEMAMALEAAEARLRSILETVPDAMIIIDERGNIESLSTTAQKLFGYELSELAGRNVSLLMPSPDREQHDIYLRRYLKTGEKRIIGVGRIVVGERKDGTTFPMHLTVGELSMGERHYFTGFIRDLTDQQLTEIRMKELQS